MPAERSVCASRLSPLRIQKKSYMGQSYLEQCLGIHHLGIARQVHRFNGLHLLQQAVGGLHQADPLVCAHVREVLSAHNVIQGHGCGRKGSPCDLRNSSRAGVAAAGRCLQIMLELHDGHSLVDAVLGIVLAVVAQGKAAERLACSDLRIFFQTNQ